MAYYESLPWHAGEDQMHKLLHIPDQDNPTSLFLNPFCANVTIRSPLLAVGAIDEGGRPWTTLLGGEPGFARPIAQDVIGVKALVDRQYDPVIETLFGKEADGKVIKPEGAGRMVGGLAIDLETRKRAKLYGRMIAGAIQATTPGVAELQLVTKIEQSLGNCPKYLNKKHIIPTIPQPRLISDSFPLPQAAVDLVAKADLFFISSSNHCEDMDTNHRGGPPGFTRIASNDKDGCVMVYPEYSGNRLYQTLGNLYTTPQAGLVFPDFDTGNVLYVTGTTEILVGEEADKLLPRTNLDVKINVTQVRFVERGLSFMAQPGELSPYNPAVKLLATEQKSVLPSNAREVHAKLVDKKILTPTIARFRFHLDDPEKSSRWQPGQYVALSFEKELDIGYSHMRDDDPQSLNDDYLRTFTISSPPGDTVGYEDFEITIRKVGPVTTHLFRQNPRRNLEVPIKGFGGEFFFEQQGEEHVSFVAGGVGITPLLAQAPVLDLNRLKLYWSVAAEDLGLVVDTFERIPGLAKPTILFVTGVINPKAEKILKTFDSLDIRVLKRRLVEGDLELGSDLKTSGKWYICTGPGLRAALLKWLKGRTVSYEDFNY